MPSPHWRIIWSNKISFYAVSITPDTLFPSQRSYSGENTASAIARSCASLALSLLVPVLVVWHKDDLVQVLSVLQAGLPGTPTADDSQAVQFHSGLALGMVLSSLQHQRLRLVLCVCSNDSNTGCKPSFTFTSMPLSVVQWCLGSEGHWSSLQLLGSSGKLLLQPQPGIQVSASSWPDVKS